MTRSKFIVVEHDARRAKLHYDLRFQMPKSSNWASFAIRKGIPTKPGLKHLAIRTHDHSRAEALFTGTIEKGYGAGKLKKWDDGSCIIHKFSPSHIAIEFKGRKVKGMYHLISLVVMKKKKSANHYFLFKGKVTVKEWMGMISRIPSGGIVDEVELDQSELTSPDLPWDKTTRKVVKSKQIIELKGRGLRSRGMEREKELEEPGVWEGPKLSWSKIRAKIKKGEHIKKVKND
jgi:DNA ligase D-like protein (predicted 3'-phosphoesterase)